MVRQGCKHILIRRVVRISEVRGTSIWNMYHVFVALFIVKSADWRYNRHNNDRMEILLIELIIDVTYLPR